MSSQILSCYSCGDVSGFANTVNEKMEPVFVCKKCMDEDWGPAMYSKNGCVTCCDGNHDVCLKDHNCGCEYCGYGETTT